jgi:hypothetical protein
MSRQRMTRTEVHDGEVHGPEARSAEVHGTGPRPVRNAAAVPARVRRSDCGHHLVAVTMTGVLSAVVAFALGAGTAGAAGLRHRPPVTTVPAAAPSTSGSSGTPATPATTPVAPTGGAQPSVPTGAVPGSGAPTTCSTTNLSLLQSYVEGALSNRVSQLNGLTAIVGGATRLTGSDQQTLSSDVSNELAGIEALQQNVPNDSTCLQLVADARAMVRNFRVYVVMTPQVRLTVSADSETSIAGQLAGLEPQIQAAIAAAQKNGKNVAGAQQSFSDLQTQVTNAQSASGNVSGPVLAFTPSSYPGCKTTFVADVTSLQGGRADLRKADADLHTIVADLA